MDGNKARFTFWLCLWLLFGGRSLSAQGLALNGIGPINQSMGGAAVACPIDAAGALHWNPATLSGLKYRQTAFGVTLALPSERLSSSTEFPFPLQGSDRGEPGVSPIPYAAFVDRDESSSWTYGIGIFGVGGFRSNYPASATNPVLTSPPPNGVGVGRLAAEAQLLQIVPTISYAISERLSVGVAPTISLGRLTADPLLLAAPDDANGDGFFTAPSGSGNRYHWGGGFQLGLYYLAENNWHYGASFKSKQWFERFRFKTADEIGRPRTESIELEYPTIVSIGTAYSGWEHVTIAADFRYFGYADAAGLGPSGFNPDGSVAGLGWDDIFALGIGAQFCLTDRASARCGYSFNENPIGEDQASANVASPVITQHFLNLGASYFVRPHWILSLAYTHGFENELSGPIVTPQGPIPRSRVTSDVSINGLTLGVTVRH
jgi:long-chain fatty acid transport protein